MRMLKMKYILFAAFLLLAVGVSAQKAERDYIRKGNRLFNDSVFVDAEVNYRKALEVNPKSAVSMYNLGNTLSQQQKFQEAMEQYDSASKIEKDKMKLAHIYHNMGVLFQAGKDYAKAVDAYKMSLRNNPADHETRYNLALAQKMLKDQQNQQDQDQNQDQDGVIVLEQPDLLLSAQVAGDHHFLFHSLTPLSLSTSRDKTTSMMAPMMTHWRYWDILSAVKPADNTP